MANISLKQFLVLFKKIVVANLEMAGIAVGKMNIWNAMVLISIAGALVFDHYFNADITFWGAICWATFLFVLRQAFLFLSFGNKGISIRLAQRFGEWSGSRIYVFITSLFFYHRSYSLALLGQKTAFYGITFAHSGILLAIGLAMSAVGFVVNTWSYLLIGKEAYYYMDMYHKRFFGSFSKSGPYRYLNNPMYGLGQLSSYGFFVAQGSIIGIVFTLANQLCCYAFYHFFEKPHIKAMTSNEKITTLHPMSNKTSYLNKNVEKAS